VVAVGKSSEALDMDWPEVNCLLEALGLLIEKYKADQGNPALSEDQHADLSNDLAYAEVLRGKYESLRKRLASV
jgi:hypothetical protein